jgi:hypothetical protein
VIKKEVAFWNVSARLQGKEKSTYIDRISELAGVAV